jgi:hypothetical protein
MLKGGTFIPTLGTLMISDDVSKAARYVSKVVRPETAVYEPTKIVNFDSPGVRKSDRSKDNSQSGTFRRMSKSSVGDVGIATGRRNKTHFFAHVTF